MTGGCALALLAALAFAPAHAAAEGLVLEGTWHVLMHYRDAQSANPEQVRWDDRLWVFEREGDRLRWTRYPIVVFDDEGNRFSETSSRRVERALEPWQPTPEQLEEIREGVEFAPRGVARKSLRGSPEAGWSSGGRSAPGSASEITYSETWSIADPTRLPVFTRSALLASARAEAMEGVTRFTTERVEAGGNLLRGTYERDGRHLGVFWATRAGTPEPVAGAGQRAEDDFDALFYSQLADAVGADESEAAALAALRAAPGDPAARRAAVAARFAALLTAEMNARGNDARRFRPQLERMAEAMAGAYLEGQELAQIRDGIRRGALRP